MGQMASPCLWLLWATSKANVDSVVVEIYRLYRTQRLGPLASGAMAGLLAIIPVKVPLADRRFDLPAAPFRGLSFDVGERDQRMALHLNLHMRQAERSAKC